jgi:hypothetical protein
MKWLSPEDVESLTKYKQPTKQRDALNQMGVNHVVRPDGSIVVFESDLTSGKKKEMRFVIDG